MRIKTVDAHTAGEPLRLIIEGFPIPGGRTMIEKREWLRSHCDHLRRALMLEPRGHADMYGALLTAPERPGSDAGVLFMHNEGYSTMCGHGVIAVVTLLLTHAGVRARFFGSRAPAPGSGAAAASPERPAAGAGSVPVVLDAPAGEIRARAHFAADRIAGVSFRNVPSFVLHAGVPVRLGSRELRADVAFGGAFYAIVDSEAIGIPIRPDRLPELRRAGMDVKQALERALRIVHPQQPEIGGIYGTIFTGPPSAAGADLKNVTVFADAEVDRSPCGTGTSAVMAVLAAMGLLGPEQTFTHESIIGTTFQGRVVEETTAGDLPAIVPEISGEAYLTGESSFEIDDRDPLAFGFRL